MMLSLLGENIGKELLRTRKEAPEMVDLFNPEISGTADVMTWPVGVWTYGLPKRICSISSAFWGKRREAGEASGKYDPSSTGHRLV
jgi:hypothetical protein